MMDGEEVYRARLSACLAAAEGSTLPQVRARHLAAAKTWQTLLDAASERRNHVASSKGAGPVRPAEDAADHESPGGEAIAATPVPV